MMMFDLMSGTNPPTQAKNAPNSYSEDFPSTNLGGAGYLKRTDLVNSRIIEEENTSFQSQAIDSDEERPVEQCQTTANAIE